MFGPIRSLGNTGANVVDAEERFKAMYKDRSEAPNIVADHRIATLRCNIPPSAKYQLQRSQTAMAYREKQKCWITDMKVVGVSSKEVCINNGKREFKLAKPHAVSQPGNADYSAIYK